MILFSHDPQAGTLYCYFTELEAGQAVAEWEYPASLLLDRAGRIIGVRLKLDDEITLDQLELALEHEHVSLDMQYGHLNVSISTTDPAQVVDLEAAALLDLDDEGRVLGFDIAVPKELTTPTRLAVLEPYMVALDDADVPPTITQRLPPRNSTAPVTGSMPTLPTDRMVQPVQPDGADLALLPHVGFVALVGKPNVGKSTLLNAMLGQKVAIVSPRPQTTRVPLRGILTRPDAQVIFIDTPGIHEPRHKLGQFMVETARRSIPNADVVCMVVDMSMPPTRLDERIAAQVQQTNAPRLLVLNKVDRPPRQGSHLDAYRALGTWDTEVAVSARTGQGLSALLDAIIARLPSGHALYPAEQVVDQTEQHLVAELIREKVLHFTRDEVPHSVAVEVEEWEQRQKATYIRLSINVEKESQKGILIGAGGEMLKRIGTIARVDVEQMLGHPVFLDLWVKTRPNWRNDPASLGWLGYRLKDWQC